MKSTLCFCIFNPLWEPGHLIALDDVYMYFGLLVSLFLIVFGTLLKLSFTYNLRKLLQLLYVKN